MLKMDFSMHYLCSHPKFAAFKSNLFSQRNVSENVFIRVCLFNWMGLKRKVSNSSKGGVQTSGHRGHNMGSDWEVHDCVPW